MGRLSAMPKVTPPVKAHVSEHAVLRYLERVMGLDMDAVRKAILTADHVEAIERGARRIHMPDAGVTLMISETGVVTTCMPLKGRRR